MAALHVHYAPAVVVVLLLACAVQLGSSAPTSCYSGGGNTAPVPMVGLPAGSDLVCVRYCFTCTSDDTACSVSQSAAHAVLPGYATVESTTAAEMAAMPFVYSSFYSCSTTNCNTPVSNLCVSGGSTTSSAAARGGAARAAAVAAVAAALELAAVY